MNEILQMKTIPVTFLSTFAAFLIVSLMVTSVTVLLISISNDSPIELICIYTLVRKQYTKMETFHFRLLKCMLLCVLCPELYLQRITHALIIFLFHPRITLFVNKVQRNSFFNRFISSNRNEAV